jgi:hypothetical protein
MAPAAGLTIVLTQERLRQQFTQPPRPWPLHPDAGPWCDCCLHIIRAGDDQPRRVPSAYMWVTMDGRTIPLCVSCCAHWRENAAADHELLPARIYQA